MDASITLRRSSPLDYPALAALHTTLFPDRPVTVDDMLISEEEATAKGPTGLWVAEYDGQIIGMSLFHPPIWSAALGRYTMWVLVQPEWQRQGLGTALYDLALEHLLPHQPYSLRVMTRADQEAGIRFLGQRGFVEILRESESALDVTTFDFGPYAGLDARLAAAGITIRSLDELADDPQRDRKLYDLEWALFQDTPGVDLNQRRPFAQWVAEELRNPRIPHAAYFVALDGADYIGLSHFWAIHSQSFDIGLTAVRRAYRNQGIATALKLRGVQYARAVGCPTIKTSNAVDNDPMLAVNRRMGFVPQPVWITFEKVLHTEGSGA